MHECTYLERRHNVLTVAALGWSAMAAFFDCCAAMDFDTSLKDPDVLVIALREGCIDAGNASRLVDAVHAPLPPGVLTMCSLRRGGWLFRYAAHPGLETSRRIFFHPIAEQSVR
jgi:hypothetical protein